LLPRLGFVQLSLIALLTCSFLVFGNKHAEAEKGLASWYGPGLNGLSTASGESFNADGNTAASKTLPLGTRLSVSYGGRSVQVTVNDRGPFVDGRDLDLSQGAAQALGLTQAGVDYVDYSYAEDPGPSQGPNLSLPQGGQGQEPGSQVGVDGSSGTVPLDYSSIQGAANNGTYVVQPGDTLSQVADRLGTSVDQLAVSNGIADPNLIHSGQALHLQAPGENQPGIHSNLAPNDSVGTGGSVILAQEIGGGDGVRIGNQEALGTAPASDNGDPGVPGRTVTPGGAATDSGKDMPATAGG
jgi:peptidoglycan lytic transglycosylase